MEKSGMGVYRYPSRARYEGEWRDNLKAGFGIYYYPKGGIYKVRRSAVCVQMCHG